MELIDQNGGVGFVDVLREFNTLAPDSSGGGGGGGGGEQRPAGNFEPVFGEDGSVVAIGPGYYMYGRRAVFVSNTGVSFPASGEIGFRVKHAAESYGPSFEFVNLADGGITDDTHTLVPLYFVDSGKIIIDYRACPTIPVRE